MTDDSTENQFFYKLFVEGGHVGGSFCKSIVGGK